MFFYIPFYQSFLNLSTYQPVVSRKPWKIKSAQMSAVSRKGDPHLSSFPSVLLHVKIPKCVEAALPGASRVLKSFLGRIKRLLSERFRRTICIPA
jgi:hypothetical protein